MPHNEITGGKLLARALQAEGIEILFGLPSPEIDPLLAQLEDHGIRLFPMRHEAAAVHMAEGYYKTTGKVAAVLGNPGPGSANLIPGVTTALHEGVPVLAISSQHRLGIAYPSPPSTFQGQDQIEMFRPVVKWTAPVLQWERIPEIVRLAFRNMWTGRPGPVHIDLPAPLVYETGDASLAPILGPSSSRAGAPLAAEVQLEEAAQILLAAERPIVVAGTGVDRAFANDELLQIVELLDCPVLNTQAGRATVPHDHPNFIMGFGEAGDLVRKECDAILAVGTRMGNLDLPFDKYWGDPAGQKLVQIDVEPRNMGVTRPLTLGIVADAKHALAGLSEKLRAAGPPARASANDDRARYRQAFDEMRMLQAKPVIEWAGPGIHPAHAIGVLGAVFGGDAIYTADGGNTNLWAYALLPSTRPRSYHTILELGMLGTGIPQAIGAKLGEPERDVVCVTGDGAAGFNIMEMQSAAREQLNITTVVLAEGSWTMEEPNELALYRKTFGTAQGEIRWDKVAEGLGCHSEYVDSLDELESALQRAKEHDGPSLVCVRSDHDANLAVPENMLARFFEVYSGPTASAPTGS
ncbi:MAG: thiamine pyrophosphate-binding protein [Thermoleophilaceae bacterium]|nr:thiamine pyrophosphate-binding protein [Thermoleophilaceae bacterium]